MEEITYAFPKLKHVDPSCYIDAYNIVLECSEAHTPRSFCVKLLELLKKACPYDAAVVFFLDANGKAAGHYTVGMKDKWVRLFLEYYNGLLADEGSVFDIFAGKREHSNMLFSNIIDWSTVQDSEFKSDYIRSLGLRYSWGFAFFDLSGRYRVILSLDRTTDRPFSETEQNRLRLALPILNNMHRNFFYQAEEPGNTFIASHWQGNGLTEREAEIVSLLSQGMTPKNISDALSIALNTTYKHKRNIFKKLGVSSQKELLLKLYQRE